MCTAANWYNHNKDGDEDYEDPETEHLILRPFEETDFEAVHAYTSVAENVQYMIWGPNDKSQTKAFILQAIAQSKKIHVEIISMLPY